MYVCVSEGKNWDNAYQNRPSKICGRQALKIFTWSILEHLVANVSYSDNFTQTKQMILKEYYWQELFLLVNTEKEPNKRHEAFEGL